MSHRTIIAQTQSPSASCEDAAIRGITNTAGSNNCFLNCSVQALWNLNSFRHAFASLDHHRCPGDSCIFCSLQHLASNYQHLSTGPVTPDLLRTALAKTYESQRRFQLGYMEDAAECLEGLLQNLHLALSSTPREDGSACSDCIAHQLFSMTLVEQAKCGTCGASSEPFTFDQYIMYIPVQSLVAAADPTESFGTLLQRTNTHRKGCGACGGAESEVSLALLEQPAILCLGLAWPEASGGSLVRELVERVEEWVDLDEAFAAGGTGVYRLVGAMVYYGKHYFTFFFHSGVKKWLLYDDASVSEVGTTWESVRTTLVKGKYQPLVLLYENPQPAQPITTAKRRKAPKRKLIIKRLACMAPASPVNRSRKGPPVERQESMGDDGLSPHHPNFLESVVSEVGDRMERGLSVLGLKDGEKLERKRFIADCMKQADNQLLDSRREFSCHEYHKSLDMAIDAASFYKFIIAHTDASQSQRAEAQVRFETAATRCKRIARRIPVTQLTEAQKNALFAKCPLCDNYREEYERYCAACTRYCAGCGVPLELTQAGEWCDTCAPQLIVESRFERNLAEGGHSSADVVWYDTAGLEEPPPPYETLRKVRCRLCKRMIVTNSDMCNLCANGRGYSS